MAIAGAEVDSKLDVEAIRGLADCDVTWLEQPTREDLNKPFWEESWDILFFAGHSYSSQKGQQGAIKINSQDWLTISELRNHLRKAIELGLRLAIFNSCDGLGLAYQLAEGEALYLPQVIVMREHLPVQIAPKFLRYFLEGFTKGKSLYSSVREARQQLYLLEGDFPCGSWLPVICQNPAVNPPTWSQFCHKTTHKPQNLLNWQLLYRYFAIACAITGLVMGLRGLGMLEILELQAFDQLLRARRPYETLDERLFIVQATPEDMQRQEEKSTQGASLSDPTLTQLLEKLKQYEPVAIGLDIYRDFPVASETPELATYLEQKHLFGICKVKAPQGGDLFGVAPPPEISLERLGFSDAVVDPDGIIRRHLLGMKPEDPTASCPAKNNLSLLLALYYLQKKEAFQWNYTLDKELQLENPKLGKKVVLQELKPYTGGYQGEDTGGRQILLNYRSRPSPLEIAQTVTVQDILSDRIPPHKIAELKHRVILIGIAGPRATNNDYWLTPYSENQSPNEEKIAGVFIQAHMVSQLLSAVLDNRPLLWVLPIWGEVLWIAFWSWVGSLIIYFLRSLDQLSLGTGLALGVLYGVCYLLIEQGGWVPLVPSAIALLVTLLTIMLASRYQSSDRNFP